MPRRTTRRNPVGTHGRYRDPIVTQLRQAALDVREVPVPKPGNVVLPDEGVPEHILHQREQHECWDEDVGKELGKIYKKAGMNIMLESTVEKVEKKGKNVFIF